MTGKQRVAAAFSHHHHEKVVLHDCFVLLTTCNILYFVFELTICLLYHLQLHTHASVALQWLHMQCSSRNEAGHKSYTA